MKSNPTPAHILEARNVSVSSSDKKERREIVHDVSFHVGSQELLVILGSSGSGKTVLSRALTRLFPLGSNFVTSGSVAFEGVRLDGLDEEHLARIRRCGIRYVFQDPMQSLNPLARVRTQLHHAYDDADRTDAFLIEALAAVGIGNGKDVLDLFPHQLSIGMAQRICIAMALLPSPRLLIADEPTSAVDASLRYKLLDLLASVRQTRGLSMILITHDLEVARSYGDRVIILYGGRIVETAPRLDFFEHPLHPYSRLLLDTLLKDGQLDSMHALPAVSVPPAPSGCRFYAQCSLARPQCALVEPELEYSPEGREIRCFYWK